MERHGPMVMGACRRILGDTHAAEDAFQAAFLVLARKAAGLPRTGALAGWLYGVARRVALKARSYPLPELLPAREPEARGRDPLAEMTGREILAILEEEVHRLPTRHRLPVVLCCLEGLTLEEAAARLGCTPGALRGRLERGRGRLRARLTERGLAPAAVLTVAGAARVAPASPLPPGLRTLAARAALDFASRTGPVPDGPRHLAEGVLRAMRATERKLAVVAVIAPFLLVPALLARTAGVDAPPAVPKVGDMSGEKPTPRPGPAVTGRVLSEPGGKGVAGVVVTLWNGDGLGRRTARTNASGAYSFPDVEPGDHYRVWIEDEVKSNRAPGTWSEWGRVTFKDRKSTAEDLFVEMPQSVSGTVTDTDAGKPVPGAEVNFSAGDRNRDSITTDGRGRYRLFVPPREVDLYRNGTRDRYEESEQRHQGHVRETSDLPDTSRTGTTLGPARGCAIPSPSAADVNMAFDGGLA